MSDEGAREFYFDTESGEVSEGRRSDWTSRLGPYPTREAAENALATARARTEAWDAEDEDDS
ncbi:hypothetical protein [Paraoerskovia marina]|uniref:Sporulation related domain-containing protein n=1 Tax=Paraoerskovia marina TaxID=545619 RepID=A0A1H1S2C8_9CELL|nr:hypothetical protein [Paraoerskovia marina]SDS42167.1 hypothetical protein SAMN04489860_1515 [Paraoerskovia marina]